MKHKRYHPDNWWNNLSYKEKNIIRHTFLPLDIVDPLFWELYKGE